LEDVMMSDRWCGRLRAVLLGVAALMAFGCGGESATDDQAELPASLVGTWELAMVSTNATGPLPASRQTYDAVLTFDSGKSAFELTEWKDGRETLSGGMVLVDGDELKLIHTADYQAVTRVDEALWSVKDNRLAMAVGETDWTVYYYDRP
jgi:hypothetical protein